MRHAAGCSMAHRPPGRVSGARGGPVDRARTIGEPVLYSLALAERLGRVLGPADVLVVDGLLDAVLQDGARVGERDAVEQGRGVVAPVPLARSDSIHLQHRGQAEAAGRPVAAHQELVVGAVEPGIDAQQHVTARCLDRLLDDCDLEKPELPVDDSAVRRAEVLHMRTHRVLPLGFCLPCGPGVTRCID